MAKRIVFRVMHNKKKDVWDIRRSHQTVAQETTKAAAVAVGQDRAKAVHIAGGLSQLVIHNKVDGRIQFEWTYGKDPRRSKG